MGDEKAIQGQLYQVGITCHNSDLGGALQKLSSSPLNPYCHLVVAVDSVICHVALTRFDEDNFIHILPINRVCAYLGVQDSFSIFTLSFTD